MSAARHSGRHLATTAATSTIILVTALVCVLPWTTPVRIGDGATALMALVPAAAICACVVARPWQTPSLAVFLAGLLMDTVTAGPLGYWALVNLTAASVARGIATHVVVNALMLAWVTFGLSATAAAMVGWAVTSLYRLHPAPVSEIAFPAIVAVTVFPVATVVTRALLAVVAPAPAPAISAGSE